MEINTEFWIDKKVLVTGHTGFKGSWLSFWLNKLGARVSGFALEPEDKNCLFKCVNLEDDIESHIGDIRDFQSVRSVLEEIQPDFIFHLAAQSLVRKSYEFPIDTFSTNIMGTVHIFEAVHQIGGVRAIINVTSDKCYLNNPDKNGYVETDPMGGDDPYSASKGCSELITNAMRKSFLADNNCHVASVRAGNVIGGGDWAKDRLVPDIMKAFIVQNKALIRNPNAIRPWQHVLEPINGYIFLAEKLWDGGERYTESWNFGPDLKDQKSVSDVAQLLSDLWGKGSGWELYDPSNKSLYESITLRLDCSKTREKLGWKPNWSLIEGLEKTVEWYKAFSSKEDLAELCRNQINTYMKKSI